MVRRAPGSTRSAPLFPYTTLFRSTTHSSTVAAVPEPHQLSLVVNEGGEATGRPVCPTPLRDASSPIRGLLLSDRDATVSALMHSAVLIRSEEHTSELQSLMRNSYAVFC